MVRASCSIVLPWIERDYVARESSCNKCLAASLERLKQTTINSMGCTYSHSDERSLKAFLLASVNALIAAVRSRVVLMNRRVGFRDAMYGVARCCQAPIRSSDYDKVARKVSRQDGTVWNLWRGVRRWKSNSNVRAKMASLN